MGAGQFRRLLGDLVRRLVRDRRGNVSPIMALMLVPMIGSFGVAAEASRWFVAQRGAQNAVDAAVIAAATNACAPAGSCATSGPSYDAEAKSVTKQFGFTHDGADVVVSTSNSWPCPGGGSNCFSVLLTLKSPLYLLRITGFNGDTTAASGQPSQTVQALAVAQLQPGSSMCITAYDSSQTAILFNGGPNIDLQNCNLYAPSGGTRCNGNSADAVKYSYVAATGNAQDCGLELPPGPAWDDPYDDLASNIPPDTCAGPNPYPQRIPNGSNRDRLDPAVSPNDNFLDGSESTQTRCGDVELSGDVEFAGGSVLTIHNGWLNLNGHNLTVSGDGGLTIIFSGTDPTGSYTHYLADTASGASAGSIDFAAPTDGTWSGVALYQDPRLNPDDGLNMTFNQHTGYRMTGLIYARDADIVVAGEVNKATDGDHCLAFIVDTFSLSGTGELLSTPTRQCDRAGLTGLNKVYDKVVLVQ